GGVTVNVTTSDASRVKVSPCNPANAQSTTCTAAAPSTAASLFVPQNNDIAYFDLIGSNTAFTETQINAMSVYAASNGDIFFTGSNRIRKLSTAGLLSTVAGTGASGPTTIGPNQAATATAMSPS